MIMIASTEREGEREREQPLHGNKSLWKGLRAGTGLPSG